MHPLRLSLFALIFLAVFSMDNAEASEYTADVVIIENEGPSLSGTFDDEGEFVEFGYIVEEMSWNYTSNMRISHFDVVVDWQANGGGGGGRQVTFDVSSENNTAGESQTDGGGGGTITITWEVNELPEVVNGTADSADDFVQSYETPGEWMGGTFTFTQASQGSSISSESIDYTISLTYYTWDIENIRLLEQPDLFVSSLTFSNDNPEIGEEITFNATIKVLGVNVTDNFSVGFFLDSEDGEQIGEVSVNGSEMTRGIEYQYFVSINWTAIDGSHTIYVVVDSTDVIDESEEKNDLSKVITVGFVEPEPDKTPETTDTTEETTTESDDKEEDVETDYTMVIAGVGAMIAASILAAAFILRR